MEIKGKVHCFFEQSGTFKNQFIKLGIPAEDYDIQNNFNETDHVIDLFGEIEKGYTGSKSVFDQIEKDDLILAFFPCIMFSCISQMNITIANYKKKKMTNPPMYEYILERIEKRELFYKKLVKFVFVCDKKQIRLIIENPYSINTYLKGNFIAPPTIIDNDRTKRGDYFTKPTAYWFFNCKPTHGFTYQPCKSERRKYFAIHTDRRKPKNQTISSSRKSGFCSVERSMISPDYARNFICDFILGKQQPEIDKQLRLL